MQYIWDTVLLVFFSSWTPQEQFCDTIGQLLKKKNNEFHSMHENT